MSHKEPEAKVPWNKGIGIRSRINLSLSNELIAELKEYSKKKQLPYSQVVEAAVWKVIKKG